MVFKVVSVPFTVKLPSTVTSLVTVKLSKVGLPPVPRLLIVIADAAAPLVVNCTWPWVLGAPITDADTILPGNCCEDEIIPVCKKLIKNWVFKT